MTQEEKQKKIIAEQRKRIRQLERAARKSRSILNGFLGSCGEDEIRESFSDMARHFDHLNKILA